MRFEIVLAPHPSDAEAHGAIAPPLPNPGLHAVRHSRRPPARELLDVFIDGANVTARVRETHGAFLLRDLGIALVELAHGQRAKTAVSFYEEPWEMCIERFGATACVSVYRTGADPQVAVYDRAVPFDDVLTAVRDAIDRLLVHDEALAGAREELVSTAKQLHKIARLAACDDVAIPAPVAVSVEFDRDTPVSFATDFTMRRGGRASLGSAAEGETTERADLHALLFRGRMRAQIRDRGVDLGDCHPLLVAERLVELARLAFDAWERGLPFHARGEAAGVLVGVRVNTGGDLALTLGAARSAPAGASEQRTAHTFPALSPADFLDAALAFGRSLVRAILRHDRLQSSNLRLGPLRRSLREASESLREANQTDSKVNASPEPYRAFAAALDEARAQLPSGLPASRLRYAARWRAIVPGIDLRATYLCGDRLIVSSATEMWALDRATGRMLWRADIARGTGVVTPDSIARLATDGALRVYDIRTGEVTMRTRIAPRIGPVAGAVVHLPGLPKLVVVTEGAHHLVAVDLASGEPRWRWSWNGSGSARGRSPSPPRMKRAGRLALFTCGDGALTALDVMTGAVVWRLRDRLRFRTPPTIVHDALFVVAGGAHGVARLYCVDLYSGHVRWSAPIAEANAPCTIEGSPIVASQAAAVALRHKTGLSLAAFAREDGASVTAHTPVIAPRGTSWLAVDDAFIGNTPTGELISVDASTCDLRWRQVLGPPPLEADVPRRLEPVLRCGALFVPHTEVVVIRPRDGAVLGAISPTETIPDLLRVDERCDVYVAEESGHLIAFGALPRLSLVKGDG
jgi:outer membrane protein assembly factor BamB